MGKISIQPAFTLDDYYGKPVKVFAFSLSRWMDGQVVRTVRPGYLTVEFMHNGIFHRKHIKPDSPSLRFVDLEAEEDSDDSEVDFEYAAVFHDEIDQEQVIEKKPEMDGCEFEEVDPAAYYSSKLYRPLSPLSSLSSFEKPRVRFEGGHTGITFWEE